MKNSNKTDVIKFKFNGESKIKVVADWEVFQKYKGVPVELILKCIDNQQAQVLCASLTMHKCSYKFNLKSDKVHNLKGMAAVYYLTDGDRDYIGSSLDINLRLKSQRHNWNDNTEVHIIHILPNIYAEKRALMLEESSWILKLKPTENTLMSRRSLDYMAKKERKYIGKIAAYTRDNLHTPNYVFESQKEASYFLKIAQSNISNCLHGKIKHTGGYVFKNLI